jgi:hypothetical protein
VSRKVLMHRIFAGVWTLLIVPAVLFWKDSVLFVILCSLYANVMSSVAASEASNDNVVMSELKRIRELLEKR